MCDTLYSDTLYSAVCKCGVHSSVPGATFYAYSHSSGYTYRFDLKPANTLVRFGLNFYIC